MIISFKKELASAANWLPQLSTAINNPPSIAFTPSNLPDGRLKTSNAALLPNAGGLITWKRTPLNVPNLNYARLRTLITVPSTSVFNLRNLETDFIQVVTPAPNSTTPIPQKFNGSTRWNSVSGHFEADLSATAPAWTDIGAGPGAITPDIPHELINLYQFDYTKLTIKIISISWDGVVYPVGSSTGVQTDNWAAVWDIQLQDAATNPGSVEVIYDQTELDLSDAAF